MYGSLPFPIDLEVVVECFLTLLHVFFQPVSRFDTYPLYIDLPPSYNREYKGVCSGGDQEEDRESIVYNSYYQVFTKKFTNKITINKHF